MNQNIYGRKLEFYTYEMIQAWKIRFHQQNLDKVAFSAFTINIYIYIQGEHSCLFTSMGRRAFSFCYLPIFVGKSLIVLG